MNVRCADLLPVAHGPQAPADTGRKYTDSGNCISAVHDDNYKLCDGASKSWSWAVPYISIMGRIKPFSFHAVSRRPSSPRSAATLIYMCDWKPGNNRNHTIFQTLWRLAAWCIIDDVDSLKFYNNKRILVAWAADIFISYASYSVRSAWGPGQEFKNDCGLSLLVMGDNSRCISLCAPGSQMIGDECTISHPQPNALSPIGTRKACTSVGGTHLVIDLPATFLQRADDVLTNHWKPNQLQLSECHKWWQNTSGCFYMSTHYPQHTSNDPAPQKNALLITCSHPIYN